MADAARQDAHRIKPAVPALNSAFPIVIVSSFAIDSIVHQACKDAFSNGAERREDNTAFLDNRKPVFVNIQTI